MPYSENSPTRYATLTALVSSLPDQKSREKILREIQVLREDDLSCRILAINTSGFAEVISCVRITGEPDMRPSSSAPVRSSDRAQTLSHECELWIRIGTPEGAGASWYRLVIVRRLLSRPTPEDIRAAGLPVRASTTSNSSSRKRSPASSKNSAGTPKAESTT